ncbi:MAG: SLC13 family permease [Peptococcaceae bacterium]|nr:SLC13 family permease [Peptococcaceae bacterium]
MPEAIKNKNIQIFFVFFGIVILGWTLPAFAGSTVGGITDVGFRVLAIFLGVSYAWSKTNDIWPSLLCFFLLMFAGAQNANDMLTDFLVVEVTIFLIFLFVFLKFLEEREVGQYLAAWMLKKRILRGRPWFFLFVFFLAAFLVSSLINIFVGIYLMWGIGTSISRTLGFKPYDKFPTLLALGVSIMGAMSLSTMPWGNNSMVMLSLLTGSSFFNRSPDLGRFFLMTIPLGLIVIIVMLLTYKILFRLDVRRLKKLGPDFINLDDCVMTAGKAVGLLSLLAFFVMMLLPEFWPNIFTAPGFIQSFGYMTKIGKLVILFVILSLIRVKRQPIFNFSQLAARGVVWGVVGIYLVALPLANSLVSPVSGIGSFLDGYVAPMFQGFPVLVILMIIGFATVLLTNFTASIPVGMMMIPIAISMLDGSKLAQDQIAFLIIVLCSFGWITAGSSPAGMVMHANKDWLRTKEVVIYSIPILIIVTIVTVLYNYYVLGLVYPLIGG